MPAFAESAAEESVRPGSRVLKVFENPLNARILHAHIDGPRRLAELQGEISWAAPTTLRTTLAGLCDLGALDKETVGRSPYAVATCLTEAGREMVAVGDVLEAWLTRRPGAPIALGGEEAKVAVKALAGGWSSSLMRALAGGATTLTEVDRMIPEVSYPALERRLTWMRSTGQIEATSRRGRGTSYVVTDWLRHAIAPLCLAGRCERRHLPDQSGAITSVEVEAAILLTLPLAFLPPYADGFCTLGVHVAVTDDDPQQPPLAGAAVRVEDGQLAHATPELAPSPASWAVGTPDAWLEAVIDGRLEGLHVGGADPQLPIDLILGIHTALYADR